MSRSERHTPRWAIKEERESEAKNPGPDINEALKRGTQDGWEEPSENKAKRTQVDDVATNLARVGGDDGDENQTCSTDCNEPEVAKDCCVEVSATDEATRNAAAETEGPHNQDGALESGRKEQEQVQEQKVAETKTDVDDATWDYDAEDQLIFESIDITSAASNRDQTMGRNAKILAIQLHSVAG